MTRIPEHGLSDFIFSHSTCLQGVQRVAAAMAAAAAGPRHSRRKRGPSVLVDDVEEMQVGGGLFSHQECQGKEGCWLFPGF